MESDGAEQRWRRRLRSTGRKRLAATAAVVGGLLAGGVGIAVAQDDPPSSTSTTTPSPSEPPRDGPGGRRFAHHGEPGRFGPMGALHGEFVTPNGSGYRTMAVQRGRVENVSATSLTVRSDDGFTRTYAVDDNTLVNAGRDGIADVKQGDTVGVVAVVDGGTARAVRVNDATTTGAIHRHWAPADRPAGR